MLLHVNFLWCFLTIFSCSFESSICNETKLHGVIFKCLQLMHSMLSDVAVI